MRRKQQIQKQQPAIPLLEQLIQVASVLDRDERIALIKAVALTLDEPLYTTADVKVAVVQHLEAYQRQVAQNAALIRQPTQVKGRWR